MQQNSTEDICQNSLHQQYISDTNEITFFNYQLQTKETKDSKLHDISINQTDNDTQTSESINGLPIVNASFESQNPSSYEFSCSDPSRSPSPFKMNRCSAVSPDRKRKSSRNSLKISIPTKKLSNNITNIGPQRKTFIDKYITLEKLGQGSLGEVRRCRDFGTQQDYAVKIISFQDGEHLLNISREFFLLQSLKHPNVVRAYDFFIESKKCYIIQEYVIGFSLSEFLKRNYRMNEEQTKFVIIEATKAIQYLNQKGVSHRDITSNNILIDETKSTVKIIDFSNSKSYDYQRRMMTKTGTLSYMAPEIFSEQEYDKQVDLWSLGVVMFQLLTGELPFSNESELELIQEIQNKEILFSQQNPLFDHLSLEAIDFMRCLLQRKPNARMTTFQILVHPWLKSVNLMYEFSKLSKRDKSPMNKERKKKKHKLSNLTLNYGSINGEISLKFSSSPKRHSLEESSFNNKLRNRNSMVQVQKQPSFYSLAEADSEEIESHVQIEPISELSPEQYAHKAKNGQFSNNDTNFNSKTTDQNLMDIRKRSRSSIFYSQIPN